MRCIAFLICCMVTLLACKEKTTYVLNDTSKQDSVATKKILAKESDTLQMINVSKHSIFKPYFLLDDFVVTDTGYFDFGLGSGTYAIVKRNAELVDTIDLFYGINKVDEVLYMYTPVSGYGSLDSNELDPIYKSPIRASIDGAVLYRNGVKKSLSDLTPNFGYFASPAILNHKIYFWQVKEQQKDNRISAAVYDPILNSTKSVYLFNDAIETDDDGYFTAAYLKGDTIIFEFENRTWKFSPLFKRYN